MRRLVLCLLLLLALLLALPFTRAAFDGDGSVLRPYLLQSAEDFAALREAVGGGQSFSGCHFSMTQDISLPEDFTSIGALLEPALGPARGKNLLPFSGCLDGRGHTLSFEKGSKPLFAYVRQATVRNLKLWGEYLDGYGLVDHYVVDYGPDGLYATGCPETVRIERLTVCSGTRIRNGGLIGGYASGANTVEISDCRIEPGVSIGVRADGSAAELSFVGSFAGEINGKIENCVSSADVYGRDCVGGIAGAKGQSIGAFSISNCVFSGRVFASGSCVGGIAGAGCTDTEAVNTPCVCIENCLVDGSVSGNSEVGGILGAEKAVVQCWENGAGCLQNNLFVGTLHAQEPHAGGIIGYMHSLNRYTGIQNNIYLAGSAEKGLGTAYYLDTSCPTASAPEGLLFNTGGKQNAVGGFVEGCVAGVVYANHNRTDDPLGTDAQTLALPVQPQALKDGTVFQLLARSGAWVQDGPHPVLAVQPDAACPSARFWDLESSAWYHKAVDFVLQKQLFAGTSQTYFSPNMPMTRAMFVAILYRLEGSPAQEGANPFSDVPQSSWYTKAVLWAAKNAIVYGTGAKLFSPDEALTREQLAAMLLRYARSTGKPCSVRSTLASFTDTNHISPWALEAVRWAHAAGLLYGRSESNIAPRGTATRAEAAAIFMRFHEMDPG